MTIEQEINGLFTEEKNRGFDKNISGFYYAQAEYEGLSVTEIINN